MSETTTVHLLHHGLPRCGFSKDIPKNWPNGHKWVPSEEDLETKLGANDRPCFNCKNLKKSTVEQIHRN